MKKLCRYIVITQLILLLICLTGFSGYNIQESVRNIVLEKSLQEFQPARTFQIGLGDLDKDGDLDAVFSNMSGFSQIMMNNGKGKFIESEQKLIGDSHGVAVADIDNDNDLDIFLVSNSTVNKVYYNDGKGNFSDSGQELGGRNLTGGTGVTMSDIDGDKDLDAMVEYFRSPNKIFLNDGSGIFSESNNNFPDESIWKDIDSDGDIDIFVKLDGQGYKTLLNDGKGNFTEHWVFNDSNSIFGVRTVAFVDFDKDGDQDAIIANGTNQKSNPTKLFLNDGTGGFTDSGKRFPQTQWACFAVGDLNNDGEPDAFVSNFRHINQVWVNNGKGNFLDSGLKLGEPGDYVSCTIGDIDNDGDLDIFVSNFREGPNEIWFNKIADK
ncbi:MAG: VCBS repeat-containing protein [bacterium]|nr:VCBS repeat-containing protein [bacterium]